MDGLVFWLPGGFGQQKALAEDEAKGEKGILILLRPFPEDHLSWLYPLTKGPEHINLLLSSNILLSPCLVWGTRNGNGSPWVLALWFPQTLPTVYSPCSKPASNYPTGMCHLSPHHASLLTPA